MKTLFSLFLFWFAATCFAIPEWYAIHSQKPDKIIPIIDYQQQFLHLKILWPGFYQQTNFIKNYYITTPGAYQTFQENSYSFPYLAYLFAIPNDEFPILKIQELHITNLENNFNNNKNYFMENLYDSSAISIKKNQTKLNLNKKKNFPTSCQILSLDGPKIIVEKLGNIHNQRLAIIRVAIYPFGIGQKEQLKLADNIEIILELNHSSWKQKKKFQSKKIDQIWYQEVDNLKQAENDEDLLISEDIPEEYLIITPEQFIDSLQPLIQWRSNEGLLVTVKTISQIKSELNLDNLLSAQKLREYLALYYSQQPCLTYILLVGDVELIPVKYQNDDGTDFFYSLLDDTADMFPDVYLGRLPINTNYELQSIIEKIIAYEKMPPSKKILLASFFQDENLDGISDRNYIALSEEFKNFLDKQKYECFRIYVKTPGSTPTHYSDLTPIPQDITFEGKTTDIINTINSGVGIISHRDHGTSAGWDHPNFRIENLNQLRNKRYPIMLNVDCSTGEFDQETKISRRETEGTPLQTIEESFSESILSLNQAGVVAVIAPSRVTHNSVNDIFHRGLMGAIWPKMYDSSDSPAQRLGKILYRGRINVLREFGSNGWFGDKVMGNFRQYHILGDPALKIFQLQ